MQRVSICSGGMFSVLPSRSLRVSRYLLALRICGVPVLVTPARNKSNFGGLSEDPYTLYKRKLKNLNLQRSQKIELVSRERRVREMDLPVHVSSLNRLISQIIPLEPFAKAPMYTSLGLEQRYVQSLESFKIMYSRYTIKKTLKNIDPFVPAKFAQWAQEKFIEANIAREKDDYKILRELMTINVYERSKKVKKQSAIWEFVEETEPPRVVSTRVIPFSAKDNLFAQAVVRMSIRQIYALYDDVGKLVKGDPDKPEDVIAYVVFERPLLYAKNMPWKICAKLPSQLPWRDVQKLIKEKKKAKALKNYKPSAQREQLPAS